MQIQIELTEESRELLMRHFKETASLHEVLARAQRNDLAGVTAYSLECDAQQATELLRWNCPGPLSAGARFAASSPSAVNGS